MSTPARPNGHAAAPATTVEAPAETLLDRVVEATRYSVRDVETMAKKAAASRLFGMDEAQAFTLMMIAESEGLHPIQALKRYHIIHNRPSMRSDAMLAEMMRQGWTVRWITESHDPQAQGAFFSHPRRCPDGKTVTFTMEDAERAGLTTDLWRKYPGNMMRSRVISNACRMLDPGIVVGIYTPEEVSDIAEERPAPRVPIRVVPEPGLPDAGRERIEYVDPATMPKAPAAAEPAEPHPISDCRRWIQDRLDRANADWATTCALSHKDYKPLCNLHQCVNGIMSLWLEDGVVYPDAVETDGKRDKTKVASMLKDMWAEDEMEVKDAVEGYLRSKEEEAAKAAGINLDSTPAEPEPAEATADA